MTLKLKIKAEDLNMPHDNYNLDSIMSESAIFC